MGKRLKARSGVVMTRTFGGKRYTHAQDFPTKTKAKAFIKRTQPAKGKSRFKNRVVKSKGRWHVYSR